ncbi:pentapeptide repeat-containing protein [Blastopirellula sp. JC732]|uniref:Pentapeptide repeat-containing protein n=1 Tax=Blastopirellula sediminis TaxID=2894196 RepID=A0A9X1MPZ7_9BACT|nr:pentapeptide repeat-containing protein [Blastopirellula sediminis]MCC9606462.1 pentapeptide repeat-containing protein [Blastopirellula sediminis]MCC9630240.1 pentapeptide repeat-containing protein [Blastopirellula sediminis]
MNSQPGGAIFTESRRASRAPYNEAALTPERLVELRQRHPSFSGDWAHLARLEAELALQPGSAERFARWNRWRLEQPAVDNPRFEPVHLEGASLRRADFRGANLDGAFFCQAELAGADLREVSGKQADFQGTNLARADLSRADLTGARLTDAALTGVMAIAANLGQADLSSVDLVEADCRDCRLTGAKLVRMRAQQAILTDADCSGAELRHADLEEATLEHANFTDANLEEANLHYANGHHANFTGAKLDNADLSGASCLGADFTRASFYGAVLRQANLGRCQLTPVYGLLLDETFLAGDEFTPKASDPWNTLLNTYTWRRLLIMAAWMTLFFVPFLVHPSIPTPQEMIEPKLEPSFLQLQEAAKSLPLRSPEFDRFAVERYYAMLPRIHSAEGLPMQFWLVLGGIEGLIFWTGAIVIVAAIWQRAVLNYYVSGLRQKAKTFRRTPSVAEYCGQFHGPSEEDQGGAAAAMYYWLEGHLTERVKMTGGDIVRFRPFRVLALPSWVHLTLSRWKQIWNKMLPDWVKTPPPASLAEVFGVYRMHRVNRLLIWTTFTLIAFIWLRWAAMAYLGM